MTRTQGHERHRDDPSRKVSMVWADPIPLDEAALQHTLARARRLTARRRRWRSIGTLVPAIAIVSAVMSMAAGHWTWSGRNSEEELSFGNTIEVIAQRSFYEPGNVRAAIGRLHSGCKMLLVRVLAMADLPSGTLDSLVVALEGPEPQRAILPRGFTALERRLADGGELPLEDVPSVVQAIEAGIFVVRDAARANPELEDDARQFCGRLRNTIRKARE